MNILGQEKQSIHSLGGQVPNNISSIINSKLHDVYSLNGKPFMSDKPKPSRLDLNGNTPPQYIHLNLQ